MRLSHNIASLNVYSLYSKAMDKQSKALERISSGYKVSMSKDNPGNLAQSEKIRMQIRGLQMAGRNTQDGISMLQTAEGGLDNITSMLQRVRELTVQQQNGTNNNNDKTVAQKEIDQLINGISSIADTTEFNGVKILADNQVTDNTKPEFVSMPVGANVGDKASIPMYNLKNLNVVPGDINSVDNAIDTVLSIRTKYGALENRFESGISNINEVSDKMEESDSNLRDADIAEEMMEYTKDSILSEAGNAMMVQSNKLPQDVLIILENIKGK